MAEIGLERPGHGVARSLRTPLARRPGRPSGLDDDRLARFFEAIGIGMRPTPAARLTGVSTNTLAKWLRRGRGLDPSRPTTAEYVRFVEMVEQREAQAEFEVLRNLTADLKGHPLAAIKWLATRWPQRYGRSGRERTEDDGEEVVSPWPAEPEPTTATIEPTRALLIPADQLGAFADRIYLLKRGVKVAPSLAAFSVGPDEDFDSEIGE
jgi:hypothetical protein